MVDRILSKIRFALLSLLLVCSAAFAQAPPDTPICDSTTHLDNNGNTCTNFRARDGGTGGSVYVNYTIYWEDSDANVIPKPFPCNLCSYGSFGGNNNQITMALPYDPFELNNPYGYTGAILNSNGTVFPPYQQLTVWAGAYQGSNYTVTTTVRPPSGLYADSDYPNEEAYVWSSVTMTETYIFTGCTGVGRWRRCHWNPQGVIGEASAVLIQ